MWLGLLFCTLTGSLIIQLPKSPCSLLDAPSHHLFQSRAGLPSSYYALIAALALGPRIGYGHLLIRMTGKWPLPVHGGDELPLLLDCCPASHVTVVHGLCDCVGVEQARRSLHAAVSCPLERSARSTLIQELFKDDSRHEVRAAHIRFVAAAVGPAVRQLELGRMYWTRLALPRSYSLCRLEKEKLGNVSERPEPDEPHEPM